jgi:hypothetical protein
MALAIASRKHFIHGQQRKHNTCTKHRSSRERPHTTNPREQQRRATVHATQGERKRGEKSQQQRPRVAGHATTSEQRTKVNSLSDSLESAPYHDVFASGSLTFQFRSCRHSTLHSKVFKKHSVDTSTIRGSTRTIQTKP